MTHETVFSNARIVLDAEVLHDSQGLADQLDPGDQATLKALLDTCGPGALTHGSDLHIRGTRTITLARRRE